MWMFSDGGQNYCTKFIIERINDRGNSMLRQAFPILNEWYKNSFWAPSCYHGSAGHGWEIVEKCIGGQDKRL